MMSGRLDKSIVIEHTRALDVTTTGSEVTSEKENIPTRAQVQWGSGSRRDINDEIVPYYAVTFITWSYLYGRIAEGDTVVYAGKKYIIDALQPVPEQKMLYIKCLTA